MARNSIKGVIQRLESLQRAGVSQIRRVRASAVSPALNGAQPPSANHGAQPPSANHGAQPPSAVMVPEIPMQKTKIFPPVASTQPGAAVLHSPTQPGAAVLHSPTQPGAAVLHRSAALADAARDVAACTRCKELARTRTQTVFGVGNPYARLVFCGEAPGADEDRLGEPFVGRAGQLLTDIIVKGMNIRREDVYILNILRCRPPQNRNPLPLEAANCREYLDRQLAIIQPEFICCLGTVAAQNLLGVEDAIGRLRGRMHDYRGIQVLCTYHPAYLLRNPSAKRQVWDDIQVLMAAMARDAE